MHRKTSVHLHHWVIEDNNAHVPQYFVDSYSCLWVLQVPCVPKIHVVCRLDGFWDAVDSTMGDWLTATKSVGTVLDDVYYETGAMEDTTCEITLSCARGTSNNLKFNLNGSEWDTSMRTFRTHEIGSSLNHNMNQPVGVGSAYWARKIRMWATGAWWSRWDVLKSGIIGHPVKVFLVLQYNRS